MLDGVAEMARDPARDAALAYFYDRDETLVLPRCASIGWGIAVAAQRWNG